MNNLHKHTSPASRSQTGVVRLRNPRREAGSGRMVLVVLVAFALGLGAATYVVRRSPGAGGAADSGVPTQASLSQHTSDVLQNLGSPVEIRFYALLDPVSVPASLRDFAGRVDSLLTEYAAVAGDKLKVVRHLTPGDAAANAASADRLKPFNLDKGDACFLGLALSCQDRKETIPQLAPEWEQALEPDLTRAILRVANPASASPQPSVSTQPDAEAINQVKSLLPNLVSVSVQQGTQLLREKAFATFADAAREMQSRVLEAQQRLAQARNGGSESDQQAALQAFQKVQTEQSDKLKEISAQLQAQIAALEYLKQK